MDDIIQFNRATLGKVPQWIERKDWEKPSSLFNYGLPSYVYHLIDRPISNQITEADMICEYMKKLKNVNYLEIGVSVGKTFWQITEFARVHLDTYTLSCLDIEKINPTFEKLLGELKTTRYVQANPPNDSIRKSEMNTITTWGPVTYYEADEFDSSIWDYMPVFNIVFSDAMHSPDALLYEYQHVKKHLDPNGFVYCFDDLENDTNGPMWMMVKDILTDIQQTYSTATLEHHVVNGWLGQHQEAHNFGVIRL
jgi:hypothetical protein